MSLRIAPPATHPSSTTNLTTHTSTSSTPLTKGAPSAPGLHDTLRANLTSPAPSTTTSTTNTPTITSTHPLEARLAQWRTTQSALKMETLRRTFGIAEPVKRGMELKIAREGEWRPAILGPSAGLSGDVLEGTDTECTWEDVFPGDETREPVGFHAEMEGRLRMDW